MYILISIILKILDNDNLGKYLISDEEKPQPKTRKIKPSSKPQSVIRKSNFSQVKINIYDTFF
jgi:hypothetical protein